MPESVTAWTRRVLAEAPVSNNVKYSEDCSLEARLASLLQSEAVGADVGIGGCEEEVQDFADECLRLQDRATGKASFIGGGNEQFDQDVELWLREVDLVEYKDVVMKWCDNASINALQELIPVAGELAVDIGLKPAQALSLRNKAAAACAAVKRKHAGSSSSTLTNEQWAIYASELAEDLQLDELQASLLWRAAGNAFAVVAAKKEEFSCAGLSDEELMDFARELCDSLRLSPPQARRFFSKAGDVFAAIQNKFSVASETTCDHIESRSIPTNADIDIDEQYYHCHHHLPSNAKFKSKLGHQERSLPRSPARSQVPSDDRVNRERHASPISRIMHQRSRVEGQPSPIQLDTKSRPREKPAWDSSWHDNWNLHPSQQKYFDPVHKKQMYTMMHYRQSSPESKHLRDVCTDESSRRSVSIASTAPGTPVHSSNASVSSSPPSRASVSTRNLPTPTSSQSSPSVTSSGRWMEKGSRLGEKYPHWKGTHGFRLSSRGSTGKPWSAAPFYNDRAHPFLGHYYDYEGEKAANRRGKLPQPISRSSPDLHAPG